MDELGKSLYLWLTYWLWRGSLLYVLEKSVSGRDKVRKKSQNDWKEGGRTECTKASDRVVKGYVDLYRFGDHVFDFFELVEFVLGGYIISI